MKAAKLILIFFLSIILIRGLFIPIMNNNSAHHANIALHMYLTGDYVNLIDQGKDYLDKPHLLFWLAALSYHAFGVTSFAYKFASFIFALVGIFSTYRLGKLLFGKEVGIYAAMILSTAVAFILSTNDVRMDAMLTSCIIFATWQLFEYVIHKRTSAFFLAALGMALGFSTKGMVAIMMPAIAIAFYYIQEYRWKELITVKWVALALLTVLFVLPVLYCFYLQFDLHPEKIIRGRSGNSGLFFLLFGQSVDRYTGKGWGTRASDPFFLIHTFLWAFLPWCILAYTALLKNLHTLFRSKFVFNKDVEFALTGTTFLLFIIVSGSQFKNPHYVNLLFPFFAIITARWLVQVDQRYLRRIFILQVIIISIMVVIAVAINIYFFPADQFFVIAGSVLLLWILLYLIKTEAEDQRSQIVWVSFAGSVLCFFLLHFNFYPKLLLYQSGHGMAEDIKRAGIPPSHIRYLAEGGHNFSMDFSLATLIPEIPVDSLKDISAPVYVFGGNAELEVLEKHHVRYEIVISRNHYNVTRLKYKFLNPATRSQMFNHHFIVKINK